MPDFDVMLKLPGFTISKTSGFNPVIHDLTSHHQPVCPHCGGCDLCKKDRVQRRVWVESFGPSPSQCGHVALSAKRASISEAASGAIAVGPARRRSTR